MNRAAKIISYCTLLLFTLQCQSVTTVTTPPEHKRELPVEVYQKAEKFLSWNLNGLIFNQLQNVTWVNSDVFWYRTQTEWGKEFIIVNVTDGRTSPALDYEFVARELSMLTSQEILSNDLPFNAIVISSDLSSIRFAHNRKTWVYQTNENILKEADDVARPEFSNLSPDGSYSAIIKDFNLWVRDMKSGQDFQLSSDGLEGYGYATNSQGWNRSAAPIIAWSADSRYISTYRLDERNVAKMHLLETSVGRPILHSWPYAIPGDTLVPMHERVVFDLKENRKLILDTPPDQQRTSNCCGLTRGTEWADNQFSSDGKYLAFVSTSRDYSEVTLKVADLTSGKIRTIYNEKDEPFFESNLTSRGVPNWMVLFETGEFLWYTRRDEWGHLYLHDLNTGVLKNRITSGAWNVVDIHNIDKESRTIWFTAVGREPEFDPYQEYLYQVNFDGSGLKLLTPEEGNHEIVMSADGRYFLDTWSDFQNPQESVLRDRNGEIILNLGKADISRLLATGWTAPEPFDAKGRDGETDIYGLVFKPSDFDSDKKYPIINNIYPGPQVGSIRTRSFAAVHSGQARAMAELGFIVVQIDGFGTPMRSKSFHTAYYANMADNGLPDQIAAMKELANRYTWIDIKRAGIYGHSGGGFATAAALMNHSDFFKVGVSSAGNHDNRGYTYYWGEKFQGPLTKKPDGTDSYTNQANQLNATDYGGRLLITYGTMDSNVHPNMTLQVIQELIRADKDFDVMVYPNRGHGYFNEKFNIRLTMNYFIRHLMDVNPSAAFRLQ